MRLPEPANGSLKAEACRALLRVNPTMKREPGNLDSVQLMPRAITTVTMNEIIVTGRCHPLRCNGLVTYAMA
nr:hypothetical protein [Paenibacillus xylanexedens]